MLWSVRGALTGRESYGAQGDVVGEGDGRPGSRHVYRQHRHHMERHIGVLVLEVPAE